MSVANKLSQLNPNLVLWTVIAIAGVYVITRVLNLGGGVTDTASKLSRLLSFSRDMPAGAALDIATRALDGLNFDPRSLGPAAALTPGAALSREDYIRLGYLEILPDGRSRITDAGRRYIEQQQIMQTVQSSG